MRRSIEPLFSASQAAALALEQALERGDNAAIIAACGERYLRCYLAIPTSVPLEIRWLSFQVFSIPMSNPETSRSYVSLRSKGILSRDMVDNEQQDALLRATAASILGYTCVLEESDALVWFKKCLGICKQASQQEREKIIAVATCDTQIVQMSVGQRLDQFIEKMEHIEDLSRLAGSQSGLNREFMVTASAVMNGKKHLREVIPTLQITGAVLENVKNVQMKDQIYVYIREDKRNVEDGYLHVGDCGGHFPGDTGYTCLRAFSIDSTKLEKNSTNSKALKQMAISFDYGDKSRTSQLVELVARACLSPYNLMPALNPSPPPPFRPGKVFFQSDADAEQPRLRMFLSMMSITSVSVVDASIEELLAENFDEVLGRTVFMDKKDLKKHFPHISDVCRGIKCGHCQKVGPSLQRCSCTKAYYCDGSCQSAHWKEHKAIHKSIVETNATA